MGNRFTYHLNDLNSSHVSIAGGKGASLGELIRAGVSVPPGFVVTSHAFERLANQRKMVRQENPNELVGQAAWPGIHRGRARVVLSPDVVGQTIEDGEVLISIQSSPALMPLLKRGGAIVTDEGGIACHAAIISRELRKPTLIGTKSATSLIHTGDLVEVDTYAQVIRIIERSLER